jgi:hypothetical protein
MVSVIVSILLLGFLVVGIAFEVFAKDPPTPWDDEVVEGAETTDGSKVAFVLAGVYACVFGLVVATIFL